MAEVWTVGGSSWGSTTATARATDRVLVSTDAQAGFVDLPEAQTRLLVP